MEVIIVTLQYAVATVNVPMSNSNDVNLANTLDNYEIVVSFDRINKLDCDFSYWQILSLVCPLKKPRDIAFIQSILERVQRWWVS